MSRALSMKLEYIEFGVPFPPLAVLQACLFSGSTFVHGRSQHPTNSGANIGVFSFPFEVLLFLSQLLNSLAQTDTSGGKPCHGLTLA